MSITDELREFMDGADGYELWCPRHKEELNHIADRIDVEHESACGEAYGNGVQSVALPDMTAYVKLPVDADGVPIRVGDVMENMREDLEPQLHHRFRVYSIRYRDYGQECALTEDGYPTILYRASECRHYHEPTVEDVLREFAEKVIDSQIPSVHPTYEEAIAEYAARLRLVGDAE